MTPTIAPGISASEGSDERTSQLIALQHRLIRAARVPRPRRLQLGTISRDEAYRVLENDVVLSHPMGTGQALESRF